MRTSIISTLSIIFSEILPCTIEVPIYQKELFTNVDSPNYYEDTLWDH